MLNMDFSERVVIDTANMDWVPSPAAGVWRKLLAREDVECGHATSIVRYDPGASFRGHNHPLGEASDSPHGLLWEEPAPNFSLR